jgi:hypothetical protein
MSSALMSPAQGAFTGITFGVGFLDWLATNSESITPAAVIITTIFAVIFGFWNAKSNSQRNKINKRDIVETLITDLERESKETYSINEIRLMLRK